MKKIFAILAIAATMTAVNAQAQSKNPAAAKAAVEKAQAATENAKQNTKTATWLKYGQTLVEAYNAPAGNAWVGMSAQELQVLAGGEKPTAEEQVVVGGQPMLKQVYPNKNLYFNGNGQLAVIEVTQPVVENALDKALEAYAKAAQLDEKGQKTKDIRTALEDITGKYTDEAYTAYQLGRFAESSTLFEKAAAAAATAPLSQIDTNAIYNAGHTAWAAQDYNRAKGFFEKSLSVGYANGGETYAKLGDIAEKLGDSAASKKYLEEGTQKFPESESLMIGLINYYINSGENVDELFKLFQKAEAADPNNPSLYYVEGNARAKLGQDAEAIAAYDKAIAVNPAYEWGYVGKGIKLYDMAFAISEKAQEEMNEAKYLALVGEMDKTLKSAVEPLEKGFELMKEIDLKKNIAEYLKNIFFRLRNESADYQAKYDEYNNFIANN